MRVTLALMRRMDWVLIANLRFDMHSKHANNSFVRVWHMKSKNYWYHFGSHSIHEITENKNRPENGILKCRFVGPFRQSKIDSFRIFKWPDLCHRMTDANKSLDFSSSSWCAANELVTYWFCCLSVCIHFSLSLSNYIFFYAITTLMRLTFAAKVFVWICFCGFPCSSWPYMDSVDWCAYVHSRFHTNTHFSATPTPRELDGRWFASDKQKW